MIFINIIDTINKIFTTREQVIAILIIIVLIYCINKKEIRSSLKDSLLAIIKILFKIPIILMVIYLLMFGVILHKVGYMKYTIIKDYAIWSIFGLFPIIINIVDKYKTITILGILRDTVKFSIIPLFIISNYTMNLLLELILIPLAFICNMSLAVCGSKEEYKPAKKVLNIVLIVISILIICFAIKGFIINIGDAKDIVFWESMGIEIVCVVGCIPVIILFRWYMLYEKIIRRIAFESSLNKFAIFLTVFKNCLLSKKSLICVLSNINSFYRIESWRDLDNRIKENLNKVSKVA
ncbi:hypothetical protein NSA45_04615 [Paraclostridium bifermentans]|uniref:hypothetical protein n=1 Tax=Paraclostridium bifermentans TaxID=1490 RepID=UPI00214A6557|nr:hypothetical protein [Paraclostridium bifermentans]MCR1875133.1 hypothetical protein [Paraclostridium bifermentans]